jgi:hypothetical protein
MAESVQQIVESPPEAPPRSTAGLWSTRLGLILLPIGGLLIVIALIGGIAGAEHYISVSGISSKRRRWSTAYYIVVGAIGPMTVFLLLFDPLRTGMTMRSRLALSGYVASVLGAMAALLLFPY